MYLHQLYVVFYHNSYYHYFKPHYCFNQYFTLRLRQSSERFSVPGPAAVVTSLDDIAAVATETLLSWRRTYIAFEGVPVCVRVCACVCVCVCLFLLL